MFVELVALFVILFLIGAYLMLQAFWELRDKNKKSYFNKGMLGATLIFIVFFVPLAMIFFR